MHIQNQDRDDVYTQRMVSADKASQCGRSMLEILAVMFVVIAITVAALHGYRSTVKQHEADRTYEMILAEIAAVLNRGSGRTNKGIVDIGGDNGYTYDGKAYGVKMGCPQRGFSVKVADVDIDLCEKLLAKEWDFPVKPLAFFRSKNWGDLCESGSPKITQDGYFMTSGEDCSRVDVGMFAVILPKGSDVEEIQVCTKGDECYACQRCNQDRQICENNCQAGLKCLKSGECTDVNSGCGVNQYVDGSGQCQACGTRTRCDIWGSITDDDGCTVSAKECQDTEICVSGVCLNKNDPYTPSNPKTYCEGFRLSCAVNNDVVDSTTGCVQILKSTCTPWKQYCDADGVCQNINNPSEPASPNDGCSMPAQSCAVAEDVEDAETGCVTMQKITCIVSQFCNSATGVCNSCPANSLSTVRQGYQAGSTGCYCKEGYYWDSENEECVVSSCPADSSSTPMCRTYSPDYSTYTDAECDVTRLLNSQFVSQGCYCKPGYKAVTKEGYAIGYDYSLNKSSFTYDGDEQFVDGFILGAKCVPVEY